MSVGRRFSRHAPWVATALALAVLAQALGAPGEANTVAAQPTPAPSSRATPASDADNDALARAVDAFDRAAAAYRNAEAQARADAMANWRNLRESARAEYAAAKERVRAEWETAWQDAFSACRSRIDIVSSPEFKACMRSGTRDAYDRLGRRLDHLNHGAGVALDHARAVATRAYMERHADNVAVFDAARARISDEFRTVDARIPKDPYLRAPLPAVRGEGS